MKNNSFKTLKHIIAGITCASLMVTGNAVAYADKAADTKAASAKYAYSIGVNHGFVWPWSSELSGDFTSNVDYACTAYGMISGVTSYKNYTPDVAYMRGDNPDGNRRIASDIVFLNGHGNYDNVCFNAGNDGGDKATGVYMGTDLNSSSGYSYVGIDSTDMSTCDHISFVACCTAKGTDNITRRAYTRGATSSLGFTDEITSRSSDGSGWTRKFNDALANGYTISRCVAYATEFYPDSDLASYAKIYGSSSNTVANASDAYAISKIANEADTLKSVPADINVPELENAVDVDVPDDEFINKIVDKIIGIDPAFDSSDYKMTINMFAPQDGTGMIKLQYIINGEISTNKAYIAYIENNKVVDITCSQATTEMQNSAMTANVTEKSVEKAIIEAVARHSASGMSVQSADEITFDSIIKIDDGYKYDYINGELQYERTVFYIVPNTNNAIGEYTTTSIIPLS